MQINGESIKAERGRRKDSAAEKQGQMETNVLLVKKKHLYGEHGGVEGQARSATEC